MEKSPAHFAQCVRNKKKHRKYKYSKILTGTMKQVTPQYIEELPKVTIPKHANSQFN